MTAASPSQPADEAMQVDSTNGLLTTSILADSDKEVTPLTLTTQSQQSPTKASAGSTSTTPGTTLQPVKKQTLTTEEKAEAQAMKAEEAKRKAEEKARKEEVKRQKEEEKKQKEEEKRQKQDEARRDKEEKQKAKDAAKAEKEAEKKAKDAMKEAEKKAREEAQAKKERSQLRLGAFFRKPATDATVSGASSRRSSIVSIEVDPSTSAPDGLSTETSEYEKTFPPFFLHAHTEMAPVILYPIDEARAAWAMEQIEQGKQQPGRRPDTVLGKRKRTSYIHQPPVKKLLLDMQGTTAANSIDLETNKTDIAANTLKSLPIKYLKFREDVRPPWIGTYSKAPQGRKLAALCRNPFRRELPGVNYDYDSEAEWEEPEEGEDLNSEGEEEEEDEDDDMEEFLDDEAAETLPKRKQLVVDLEPVYTQLNWEDSTTRTASVAFGQSTIDLQTYRIGTLLETANVFPIDPFSTSYWAEPTTKPQAKPVPPGQTRIPLNTIKGLNQSLLNAKPDPNTKPTSSKPVVTAKPLPPELMSDFKKAVSGSNLSKIGLVEVLKKDFPQVTKKTVEQTLLLVAKRVGKKEAEKVWQIVD